MQSSPSSLSLPLSLSHSHTHTSLTSADWLCLTLMVGWWHILMALIWRNCCHKYRSQSHFKLQPFFVCFFCSGLIDTVCISVYIVRCVWVTLMWAEPPAAGSWWLVLHCLRGYSDISLLIALPRSLPLCQKLSRECPQLGTANCHQSNLSGSLSDPASACLSQSLLPYYCLLFDFTPGGELNKCCTWQYTHLTSHSICWILRSLQQDLVSGVENIQ